MSLFPDLFLIHIEEFLSLILNNILFPAAKKKKQEEQKQKEEAKKLVSIQQAKAKKQHHQAKMDAKSEAQIENGQMALELVTAAVVRSGSFNL